jgi:predicted esterase
MWGALIASDSDLNHAAAFFRNVKLSIVYGSRDQFLKEGMIDDYKQLLAEKQIPHDIHTFDGGHRMDRETLTRLSQLHPSAR